MTEAPPTGTQAVGRALSVLRLLSESGAEQSISEVAEKLGLSSGTANRIMRALAAERLVARNPQTESYFLGSGAVLLGQAAQRGFGLDKMLPILKRLNEETEESVNLSIRESHESVVMLRVQSTLPLRFEQHTGARFPLYTTASGKAILAFSPNASDYLGSLPTRLEKVTPHSLETRTDLEQVIQETRERGFSIDEQENVDGVRSVGAPVLDAFGNAQAAIVIQVPAVRMPISRVSELGQRIMTAAREASNFVPLDRPLAP
ncbi:IclR family transcriptional regulator [Paeniglutamicibacter sp. MACA_103]|uniref:IclR family transcriptional regulator n=1 Tax=Paeniglutamicibacter sp. MACA_103 TaxID=3377337 RepID=UPI00389449B1